jgi:ESS family glutamate:Na+ symporter
MPSVWNPAEIVTLLIGLVALVAGNRIYRRFEPIQRLNIPAPVIGGLIVAAVTLALYAGAGLEVKFARELRDVLLLFFFATIGLAARLAALRRGGVPLALLCTCVVVLLLVQNVAGLLVVGAFGQHPFYGLLMGSASFVGGPGTAMAWAQEARDHFGLVQAPEIGIAAATIAVVTGALVSGPVAGYLVTRHHLGHAPRAGQVPWMAENGTGQSGRAATVEQVVAALLAIGLSVVLGQLANDWARARDFVMPGFLTAMLAGVVLGNVLDIARRPLDLEAIEHSGEVALQIFLVLSLMSLRLWTVGSAIWPLVVNAFVQIVLSCLVAVFVLFRLMGRDYDAAVTAGGFLGFGLSSMPVAMATMEQLATRYGPSPKAFLLITLCGSIFVDLANALIIKAFLALPLFAAQP